MSSAVIDAQFHRAVDIVQSLPKSGSVQTSYEEKLCLYSLYKQATEGDITVPRPGILDMLGRAKWDSWNKQKGVAKIEAKRNYVAAFLKILRKHEATDAAARAHIAELAAFTGSVPRRPASPSSSTSSYHSSQASPPESPPHSTHYNPYPPPDPTLPIPDVAPEIVPPSALTASHRSLLSLAQSPPAGPSDQPSSLACLPAGSRAHSLRGSEGRKDSVHSFRVNRQPPSVSALGYMPEQSRAGPSYPLGGVPGGSRPYSPMLPAARDYGTPDIHLTPYLGIQQPTPTFPPRPGSTSTYMNPPPSNIPQTLQQIQISLTALHERLSTLERSQALILRQRSRRWSLFGWNHEGDELDDMEAEVERERWGKTDTATSTKKRKKRGLTIRVIWALLVGLRRAMLDVSVGMMVMLVALVVMGGGWRRARLTLARVMLRAKRFIQEP